MKSITKVLLSSSYLAPIQYYQELIKYPSALIEQHDHYIKQTYRNRCRIIGPEGIQNLTIPIIKPLEGFESMRDIQMSEHGNWRHQHWQAIKTAYKNTPYFDYFEEDFIKFYTTKYKYLFEFNQELQNVICSLLNIDPKIELTSRYTKTDELPNDVLDLRDAIHPKKNNISNPLNFKRYYQVFEHKHKFSANLSIIDLLFNMGPESIFYLDKRYL